MLRQAAAIEMKLAEWEERLPRADTIWKCTTKEAVLPPEAAFRNRFQVYPGGMWVARIWNCYRSARIMANQTVIELQDACPTEDASPDNGSRDQRLETIRHLADELLVSWPTHFRHPNLTQAHRDLLDRSCFLPPGTGGGGVFFAGVPVLLVQLKAAVSAPGVPDEQRKWVLQALETIWAETGIYQHGRWRMS